MSFEQERGKGYWQITSPQFRLDLHDAEKKARCAGPPASARGSLLPHNRRQSTPASDPPPRRGRWFWDSTRCQTSAATFTGAVGQAPVLPFPVRTSDRLNIWSDTSFLTGPRVRTKLKYWSCRFRDRFDSFRNLRDHHNPASRVRRGLALRPAWRNCSIDP